MTESAQSTVHAFRIKTGENWHDSTWEPVSNLPFVVRHSGEDFLEVPPDVRERVLLNGHAVVLMHVLREGDVFTVLDGAGGIQTYHFAGRTSTESVQAEGQRCAFTGQVLTGTAIRCGKCGRLFRPDVPHHQEGFSCPCGVELVEGVPQPPEEVLL